MSYSPEIPYNYPNFIRELDEAVSTHYQQSPQLGETAPDFPLWHLDGRETRLSEIWGQNTFTIVEFGSFT